MKLPRNPTRPVPIGNITIGNGNPIAVQSMCATHTRDVEATVRQVNDLAQAGADVIRIAADTKRDVEALIEIRQQTHANLSVDLQENYRLAKIVALTSIKSAITQDIYTIMKNKSLGRIR